jgi:small subunit ribosomal protein S20
VANHPSAEKRNRQRITRTERNRAQRSTVRTLVKKVRDAILAKDLAGAKSALATAIVALDKASTKGCIARSNRISPHFAARNRSSQERRLNDCLSATASRPMTE